MDSDDVRATFASYPPLHQVTELKHSGVQFSFHLLLDAHHSQDNWDVLLRYAAIGTECWQEKRLARCNLPFRAAHTFRSGVGTEVSFKATVHLHRAAKFTISSVMEALQNGLLQNIRQESIVS